MSQAVAQWRSLLARERHAATVADMEALLALQEEKRLALQPLCDAQPSDEDIDDLAQESQVNIELIRHLQRCLAVIMQSAQEEQSYQASGKLSVRSIGRSRGAL